MSPWLYLGSLLNLGLLAGAFGAALLSREFAVRIAPAGELLKGGLGGLLMGIGSVLAFGCNIGGFFSALSALSLSGLVMMVGLGLGAYAGLRYVLWEVEHWPRLSEGGARRFGAPGSTRLDLLDRLGIAVFLPSIVGWGAAMLLVGALMAGWYVFATWNEQSRAFSLR